jgi:hypothetical protein
MDDEMADLMEQLVGNHLQSFGPISNTLYENMMRLIMGILGFPGAQDLLLALGP